MAINDGIDKNINKTITNNKKDKKNVNKYDKKLLKLAGIIGEIEIKNDDENKSEKSDTDKLCNVADRIREGLKNFIDKNNSKE
jgi:hypothetical protein